jgi:hypothetical protein
MKNYIYYRGLPTLPLLREGLELLLLPEGKDGGDTRIEGLLLLGDTRLGLLLLLGDTRLGLLLLLLGNTRLGPVLLLLGDMRLGLTFAGLVFVPPPVRGGTFVFRLLG